MKLQISIDLLSLEQSLNLLQDIAPFVDIIEVGSSLIKQEGIRSANVIKDKFPDKLLAVDMRTVASGGMEAEMAFRSGADFTTILAVSEDSTFTGALAVARKYNRYVVADMMLVKEPKSRAQELASLGVHYLAVHCCLDNQLHALHPETTEILTSLSEINSVKLIARDNMNQYTVQQLKSLGVDISVFGAIVYASASPREAVIQIRRAIDAA